MKPKFGDYWKWSWHFTDKYSIVKVTEVRDSHFSGKEVMTTRDSYSGVLAWKYKGLETLWQKVNGYDTPLWRILNGNPDRQ